MYSDSPLLLEELSWLLCWFPWVAFVSEVEFEVAAVAEPASASFAGSVKLAAGDEGGCVDVAAVVLGMLTVLTRPELSL